MSEFSTKVKGILSASAKFVGKTANVAAKATKFKMDELTALGKRRDLISELGSRVYELSINGIELPEQLSALLNQITVLDENLEALRANHAAEKAARAAEKGNCQSAAPVYEPCSKDAPSADAEAPVTVEASTTDDESEAPTLNV